MLVTKRALRFQRAVSLRGFFLRLEALRGSERRVVRIVGMVGLTLDETQITYT